MDTNLLLAGRTQFTEPAPADGDVAPLSLNRDGRVRVASKPATFDAIVDDITALNDALVLDVRDASNAVVHVKNTGTVASTAGAFAFEGSLDSTDGTDGTWFSVQVVRTNANTIETTTGTLALAVGAGLAYAWEVSVNAIKWFRIRCTTAMTPNSIATWTALPGSYATDPAPAIQSHGITGTVTTSVTGTVATTSTLAAASGTSFNLTTAASTNATLIKASAGSLAELTITNPTATAFYVKLYNKATAPVVGTDIPLVTIPVPANSFVNPSLGSIGKRFASGISLAVTAGIATADTAVAVAGGLISATYV